jgi:hypothetical protein
MSGVLYLCTFGLCGIGWIYDGFKLRDWFQRTSARYAQVQWEACADSAGVAIDVGDGDEYSDEYRPFDKLSLGHRWDGNHGLASELNFEPPSAAELDEDFSPAKFSPSRSRGIDDFDFSLRKTPERHELALRGAAKVAERKAVRSIDFYDTGGMGLALDEAPALHAAETDETLRTDRPVGAAFDSGSVAAAALEQPTAAPNSLAGTPKPLPFVAAPAVKLELERRRPHVPMRLRVLICFSA